MGEIIYRHAAREIGLDEGEAVRECKRELANRIRAGFGDVIARDRDRLEITHLMLSKVFLNVAHHLEAKFGRENAGILPLVFF